MRASAFRRVPRPVPAETAPATTDTSGRSIDDIVVDCAHYRDGKRCSDQLRLAEAAEIVEQEPGFVWLGLHEPTADEFTHVAKRFDLPLLAVGDAIRAHQRPKLEQYGDGLLFAVIKPVRYVDREEVVDVSELAMFVGEKFVVIVRHGETDIPRRVRALAETDPELIDDGPVAVLHRVADLVVDGYTAAIEGIDENIEDIEAQVFGGDEHDHAERIYKLKREVLEFRRAVKPLAGPLQRLAGDENALVVEAARPYFRDVHDHLLRAADAIDGHDAMLTDILQADLAQVSVRQNRSAMRQNEDMRRISAYAAIGLVPTAVAGIYGMNFEHIPGLRSSYGFYLVMGVLAVLCGVLYLLFRRNKWL